MGPLMGVGTMPHKSLVVFREVQRAAGRDPEPWEVRGLSEIKWPPGRRPSPATFAALHAAIGLADKGGRATPLDPPT